LPRMNKTSLIILAALALLMGLTAHSVIAATAALVPAPEDTVATEGDEVLDPAFEEFRERFRTRYFKIGVWVRTDFDLQRERVDDSSNGFRLSRARMTLTGEFDLGYGYLIQADFQSTPVVKDAAGLIDLPGTNFAQVGQFKSHFSREFIRNAADGDFAVLPRIVAELAPGRQIGMQVRGNLGTDNLKYDVGLFNGNGTATRNDNDEFLYVARIEYSGARLGLLPAGILHRESPDDRFVGVNVAYSYDNDVGIGSLVDSFSGKRFLVGADIRWVRGRIAGAAEIIYSELEARGASAVNPYGYHLTGGFRLSPHSQLVTRVDKFYGDGLGEDSDERLVGYSRRPTAYTRFQVNIALPTDIAEFEKYRILLSGQLKI
jgi:hypothetical protein